MPSDAEKNSPYIRVDKSEICQGDLLRGLKFNYTASLGDKNLELQYPFPYAIVLSQSCDLEQHYTRLKKNIALKKIDPGAILSSDNILDTILICPAFPHEGFLEGRHLGDKKMNDFDSPKGREKAYDKLKTNDKFNRYHYLPRLEKVSPELVIDFKRFHTVPIEIVENDFSSNYLSSLKELYRERLSQRFSNFLSRIGLPGDGLIN